MIYETLEPRWQGIVNRKAGSLVLMPAGERLVAMADMRRLIADAKARGDEEDEKILTMTAVAIQERVATFFERLRTATAGRA